MSLLLILTFLGFAPTPAEAAVISPLTVEYSTSTAPLIIGALAHRHGLGSSTVLLQKISWCESKYRNVESPTDDTGPMQINRYYHAAAAGKLGLDLEEPFDNIEYAMRLYKKEGSRPWNASKHCWRS